MCFFRAIVSRWISTLSQPLRKPHDPIYSPPLRHVRHSVCTHLVYKAFGFPSYSPTVHLICRLSGATVGLYDGETGCFVLSTNHHVHRPYTKHSDSPHIVLRCIWKTRFGGIPVLRSSYPPETAVCGPPAVYPPRFLRARFHQHTFS